ncbi:MAG TPA: cobalt-precorrin-6A reductase, partial [Polyangiales bacterium]
GTSEARLLAETLTRDARHRALLSFAGRTDSLVDPGVPHRVGGFGGKDGLVQFLRAGRYDVLIDATHAFAAQISRNAAAAAEELGLPMLRLVGAPWQRQPGDRWIEVTDMQAAAAALGTQPRRVLLTVGRLELPAFVAAPQHDYLIRTVDPVVPPPQLTRARVLCARGPFALADERALLVTEGIERLVSKNAGTPSTYAKLEAARELGVPVVMVQRPRLPHVPEVATRAEALSWLAQLHGSSRRGE